MDKKSFLINLTQVALVIGGFAFAGILVAVPATLITNHRKKEISSVICAQISSEVDVNLFEISKIVTEENENGEYKLYLSGKVKTNEDTIDTITLAYNINYNDYKGLNNVLHPGQYFWTWNTYDYLTDNIFTNYDPVLVNDSEVSLDKEYNFVNSTLIR